MSADQLKAFIEAVNSDPSLQEQLKGAGDLDAVVGIAKSSGFAISADDLKNAQGELSDKELETVAGGKPPPTVNPVLCGSWGPYC
jgi:predicted ribosomally synthesized peptide with nif11-like leader